MIELESKKIEYKTRLNHIKNNETFCTIDAEKMLLDEHWINFFKQIS